MNHASENLKRLAARKRFTGTFMSAVVVGAVIVVALLLDCGAPRRCAIAMCGKMRFMG